MNCTSCFSNKAVVYNTGGVGGEKMNRRTDGEVSTVSPFIYSSKRKSS